MEKKLLKAERDSTCRLCHKFDETVDHIISACPILAKEQYIKRHDRVSAQLHYNSCKEMGVQLDTKLWYELVQKSVETTQGGKGSHIVESTSMKGQNYSL